MQPSPSKMKSSFWLPVFLMLTFSFQITAQTQNWFDMLDDPNANFFEVKAAYEQYVQNGGLELGSGWKKFKRWEYYHESRMSPDGKLRDARAMLEEVQKYYDSHPTPEDHSTSTGNWSELGPVFLPSNGTGQPNGNGRLTAIAFHPTNPNIIYIGSPAGGFWVSTDSGNTWTEKSVGLTRLGVSSIVVHPTNPNTIFIGTGDRDGGDAPGLGVWRSTDGGNTWSDWNNGSSLSNRTVYEILMDPNDPDIMIVSSSSRIHRTTDGGATWNQEFTSHSCKDIAFHPTNSDIIYAAGSKFYRSTNNGQSWSEITSGLLPANRIAIAVSEDQPNWVYLLVSTSSVFGGYLKSTDSGQNFTTQSTTPNILDYSTSGSGSSGQGWYDLVTIADPNDANHVFTGGINVWESFDGGVSWSIVTHWVGSGGISEVHADDHVLEYNPHNGDLYLGHDGGIHYTSDGGMNWTEITSGLAIAQIYKIGVSKTEAGLVINGYQDNGTGIIDNGSWRTEIGGDGMECIIDYTDENYMYGALYYGDIRRSTNRGFSFARIAEDGYNGITESGAWVTPYELHPTDPNTMFVGYKNIWRSNDVKTAASNAVTWTKIGNYSSSSSIRVISIAPSNPNVLYYSRSESGSDRFMKSTNANAGSPTWTDLSAALPSTSYPRAIEIDPADPDHLWIAQGNNIYESTNGGSSWTDISGTLPNISLNTICYDPSSPNEGMYVGMDAGVYYRDNSMSDWQLFDTGLPPTEVTELEIYLPANECNGKLYAATYGRGLWVSDLKEDNNAAPTACFSVNALEGCVGFDFSFTDNSDFSPTAWSWSVSPATYNFVGGTNSSSQNPKIEFTAIGSYTVTLIASNGNGSDNTSEMISVVASAATTAATDDLESNSNCSTSNNCGTTICNITSSIWKNLDNGTEDNIDWRVDNGGTPSSGTGPSQDYNPGSSSGKYVYLEASNGCFGQVAILESGCVDLNGIYKLDFAYHMWGDDMGELHVDINIGAGWVEDIMTPVSGNQGNSWQTASIDLTSYANMAANFRIRGITGTDYESDIALDDIQLNFVGALPTNLLSFTGEYIEEKGNLLEWTVTDNDANETFILQRLESNGEDWKILDERIVNQEARHFFMDYEPHVGINYYQLLIANTERIMVASNIISVYRPIDAQSIHLYPNPFKDQINVAYAATASGNIELEIYSVLGQKIKSEMVQVQEGINQYPISTRDLASGIYFLRIGNEQFKVIKE